MKAFSADSVDHMVRVQNVLRRSRMSTTARLPSAAAACRAERKDSQKKIGKYHHERRRNRVTETIGILEESDQSPITQSSIPIRRDPKPTTEGSSDGD